MSKSGKLFGLMVAGLTLFTVSANFGFSDDEKVPPAKPPTDIEMPTKKKVMAAKLKQAQLILEGLALADFKKIKTEANELLRIADTAEFLNAHKGQEYQFQMMLFKRAVRLISDKAEEKNLEGVMLGYNDMTLSCLKCHQQTRNLR